MRFLRKIVCEGALLCIFFVPLGYGNESRQGQIQQLYKKIGDELLEIRRQHAQTQPRVYTLLDHVDKMHALAKEACLEKKEMKRRVKELEHDNHVLRVELEGLKRELDTTKLALDQSKSMLLEAKKSVSQQSRLLAKNTMPRKEKKTEDKEVRASVQVPVEQDELLKAMSEAKTSTLEALHKELESKEEVSPEEVKAMLSKF
ncbi:MAG: hypothetical protein H6679_01270 [Epsilonproteobacteria bacterium]|nr:hypothetical protein [Campylobacterota bacterium]